MVYTPTYTSAARVKDFFKDIDAGLTDEQIGEHIQRAEGVIFAASLGKINISSNDFSPNNKKGHAFIQGLTTKIAAFSTLGYYPGNTDINAQAALIGDTIYTEIASDLRFIGDERFLNSVDLSTLSVGDGSIDLNTENITGASLSGSDTNNIDRTYTVLKNPVMIFVDGIYLHLNTDYEINSLVITFKNQIWDSQKIAIIT